MSLRNFLDIDVLDAETLRCIVDAAHKMKRTGKRVPEDLRPAAIEDDVLVMVFETASTRTRVSFDVAMRQLGGQTINLNHTDLQLGRGESIADTARVLSRYADVIMLRTNSHDTLLELADHATIPVINGLTDKSHPCQILADIMTFEEFKGPIAGRTIAWVGDGNNVATSWMHAAVRFGCKLRIATPNELQPDAAVVEWAKKEKADIIVTSDAQTAVKGADCVITDTWVSMAQKDGARRKKLLRPYSVNEDLMAKAAKDAIFMHCLPAYRGNEVSKDVIDGPQSVIFDEAENRLHAQKAILSWCLGGL